MNPDNWAEIHNSECGWLVIIMRLSIIKSARNET